ncbi:MAG: hypothetical protein KZQ83_04220 [gamma proteobacterium symbiont of Taylorina sp.]|nr:hypothetical protein [gamma proteobacterium symbiont of Taylorina sp.]
MKNSSVFLTKRYFFICLCFIVFFLLFGRGTYAAQIAEKTPADIYSQVKFLVKDVQYIRQKNNITTPWPKFSIEYERAPQHVFQKTLEILDKINSYRIHVLKTGGIVVPKFSGRDITPNEVYSIVKRLHQEFEVLILLLPDHADKEIESDIYNGSDVEDRSFKLTITHTIVYAVLSEVSIVLDEALGIRGITSSDVYTRSEQVKEISRFLRSSQNLPLLVEKPERTDNKLSNHALQSVYRLLEQIHHAEMNLWMKPIEIPELPRKVIKSGDVYDAMGLVLAELQRIQFRLGLERGFDLTERYKNKTPDDVIYNTRRAMELLPDFSLETPLRQFDRRALIKTPNDVYSVTEHILQQLQQYRRLRGNQMKVEPMPLISGLKPQHVYAKALELIDKINLIRKQQHMGMISVPRYPLRKITPAEVFNQALRVDEELVLIYRQSGLSSQIWLASNNIRNYEDKTPSDVYWNMQRISLLLDTVLGGDVFTPDDVYHEVQLIQQDVIMLSQFFKQPIADNIWLQSELDLNNRPQEVLKQAKRVMKLIMEVQRRAGIFQKQDVLIPSGDVVTLSEVYNQVRLVVTELSELKLFLGINELSKYQQRQDNKTPGHVMQLLQGIQSALEILLHKKEISGMIK